VVHRTIKLLGKEETRRWRQASVARFGLIVNAEAIARDAVAVWTIRACLRGGGAWCVGTSVARSNIKVVSLVFGNFYLFADDHLGKKKGARVKICSSAAFCRHEKNVLEFFRRVISTAKNWRFYDC
jgi:hypothetical protein